MKALSLCDMKNANFSRIALLKIFTTGRILWNYTM